MHVLVDAKKAVRDVALHAKKDVLQIALVPARVIALVVINTKRITPIISG